MTCALRSPSSLGTWAISPTLFLTKGKQVANSPGVALWRSRSLFVIVLYTYLRKITVTLFPRSCFQAWLSVASVVMPTREDGRTAVGARACAGGSECGRASCWNQPPRSITMKEQLGGAMGLWCRTPGLSVTLPSKELSSGQCSFLTLNLQLTRTLLDHGLCALT